MEGDEFISGVLRRSQKGHLEVDNKDLEWSAALGLAVAGVERAGLPSALAARFFKLYILVHGLSCAR